MATINGTAGSDTLSGTAGDDTVYGLAGSDAIAGGSGNDLLDGGSGTDTVSYLELGAVNFAIDAATATVAKDAAGTDTLAGIERVLTGAGNDTVNGFTAAAEGQAPLFADLGTGSNLFSGHGLTVNVADFLSIGSAVAANLLAGTATGTGLSDTLTEVRAVRIGAGGGSVTGDGNDNLFYAGTGTTAWVGGGGSDTLDFSQGVGGTISLAWTSASAGTVAKGGVTTDSFSGIGRFIGTAGNDSFTGSTAYFTTKYYFGGAGSDTISGSGSPFSVADYLGGASISANLTTGNVVENYATASTDKLQFVAHIRGSAGDDIFEGAVNATNWSIVGGGGSDLLTYEITNAGLHISFDSNAYSGSVFKGFGNGTDQFSGIRAIYGGLSADTLIGSNDTTANLPYAIVLRGGGGADTIDGRQSLLNQVNYGSSSGVTIRLQTAIDLDGNWSGTASDGFSIPSDIFGSTDTLLNLRHAAGSPFADSIAGSAQGDRLDGAAGADTLDGGAGADTLAGGVGNDLYRVDAQGDVIVEAAGEGTDTVIATAGFYLYANVETLTLATGAGGIFGVGNELANTLTGNEAGNLLIAGDGADTADGGAGADTLFGTGGNDSLQGGTGADYLFGGEGADTLSGRADADVLYGEAGNDNLLGGAAIDYLIAGDGNDTLDGGIDADALFGEAGDDSLTGGNDFVFDQLVGGEGADTLDGDSGFGDYDYLYGQGGDDSYFVDTPNDLVFEFAGEGTDTVFAAIVGAGYYLYGGIENLTLLGNTPFGVGNELANGLVGNAIGNYLLGGAGDDTLNGKAGADVLFGEAGADRFVFERGTGGDLIGDFAPGTDKIQLKSLGFASFADVLAASGENGGTAFIDFGLGDFVVIAGVARASLSAGDFLFG